MIALALALLAPLQAPPLAGPQERIVDEVPNGQDLRLADGSLRRRLHDRFVELPATTDPGAILDAAADPAGLTFVAAENGLYLLDPWVDHLDRVELGEGAPAGALRSVRVDPRRRVWLATDREVGVIDPSFFWGRTLGADLLPGAGPYDLRPHPEGGLMIVGAEGSTRYVPDAGKPPTLDPLRVDGSPWDEAATLEGVYREPITIRATGVAAGGATLRYRIDGHHVWRAMEEELVLDELSPGSHTIEVVAVDRDLNRSASRSVRVRIGYPYYYETKFVLVVGALVSVASLLWFLLRSGGGASGLLKGLVSTAIFLVCAVQVLAGIVPHNAAWPFVGYDMYSHRYGENEAIYDGVLMGIRPNGERFPINPQSIGIAIDGRWQVLRPVIDGGDAAAADYVARFRERYPKSGIVGLQVQARRIRLTPAGPVKIAPLVLSHYREPHDG